MVKGITRQVVVVKGSDTALFEQAIFFVRQQTVDKGGITEQALLQEAQQACSNQTHTPIWKKLFWALSGSVLVGVIWATSSLLLYIM